MDIWMDLLMDLLIVFWIELLMIFLVVGTVQDCVDFFCDFNWTDKK